MSKYRYQIQLFQQKVSKNFFHQTKSFSHTSKTLTLFQSSRSVHHHHRCYPSSKAIKNHVNTTINHKKYTTYNKIVNELNNRLSLPTSLSFDTFILTLITRIVAGFGFLHLFSEYCFEMTQCEGPSMMPTIQPSGEIILIEKITHRMYGIDSGGDSGEKRAEIAKLKQSEWEKVESRLWLAGKHRLSSSQEEEGVENKKSHIQMKDKRLTKEEKDELMSVHTWYEPKLKEVNAQNYNYLASWKKCYEKLTTGIAVGDVVVLQHPDKEGTVCKRVLALPGDTVIRPKKHVYSSRFSNSSRRIRGSDNHRDVMNTFHTNDKMKNRHKSSIVTVPTLKNSSLLVVPDGHIWVEGDNSINSRDSRDYGPVSAALVVGKVWITLWPISKNNTLMVRGSAPLPRNDNVPFKGSTSLPAGYNGETILKQYD